MKQGEILKFRENVHPALWGLESWEISAHPSGPSIVDGGVLAGHTLAELEPGFPLLVKVIDAKERLSVQVHPNEETMHQTGGEPKTEMWAMLEDGVIYAGLQPGSSPDDIAAAVRSGSFEDLLVRHEAKKGEVFFIPGGLVHAIGAGALIYEVQQSSNTTFRLYDWNRVGKDGSPRELHIEKSLKAIDYSLPVPVPMTDIKCQFFDFCQMRLNGDVELNATDGYTVLFAAEGSFSANGVEIPRRTSALVAPGAPILLHGCSLVFITRKKLQIRT
jgi:mannose-6-phosphate isomerase